MMKSPDTGFLYPDFVYDFMKQNLFSDSIAAISTPLSEGGISIIRISGPDSLTIADSFLVTKSGAAFVLHMASHTIHYGFVKDTDGQIVDEVLVSVFLAPKSYTGENTVEINCHGGILVTKKVLDLCLLHGARLADPGEFSKRGFLNGRMDLSQAEAVMDLISAKSEAAAASSVRQLGGALSAKVRELRRILLHETAFLEAALDDPEHYSLEGYPERCDQIMTEVSDSIETLLRTAHNGRLLREGINTVILGRPNTGKSSLLNLLVGHERAIVTHISGTTRDTIEEDIFLDRIGLHLIDTAGVRSAADEVERIGIDKAITLASSADLILYVIDGSEPLCEEDRDLINRFSDRKMLLLVNKNDLEAAFSAEEAEAFFGSLPIVFLSARTGEGLSEIQDYIQTIFYDGSLSSNSDTIVTNVRHEQALREALESIRLVRQSIASGVEEDFYTVDLMNAYSSLGKILGESLEDDLVSEIFSSFCMGK